MKGKTLTVVLAILFSLVIWGFISLSEEYFYKVKANIVVVDIPSGFDIAELSNRTVELTVKGKGFDLLPIALKEETNFFVSLKNIENTNRIVLKNMLPANTWLGSNFSVDEITPTSINFGIDKLSSKKVPIYLDLNVTYKNGYDLVSEVKVFPDSIEILGARKVVENIIAVYSQPIVLKSIDEDYKERIAIKKELGIKYAFENISVSMEIQQIVDKVFNDIIVQTQNVPEDKELQLYPGRISVVLRGGIKYLGSISKDSINAYISFEQALYDSLGALIPNLELPAKTSLIRINPEKLEYIIKKY